MSQALLQFEQAAHRLKAVANGAAPELQPTHEPGSFSGELLRIDPHL